MANQPPGTEFVIAEVLEELRQLCHLRDTERGSKRHKRAVQDFTSKHVGLAYSLAARYRRRGINDQELRHTALLGLLEAINRWQPAKAACFSTFADFRMRHEIQQYLRRQLPLVRCSELVHKDQLQIGKLQREARHKLKPEPTQAELVKKTKLSPARVKAALETNTRDFGYEQLPGVLMGKQAPEDRQYCFNRNAKQLMPQPHAIEDAMIECIDASRAKPVEQVFAQSKPEPRKRLTRPGLASLAVFASAGLAMAANGT